MVQSEDETGTRWFVKKPDRDTYYGRIHHGRVYELVPADLRKFTLVNGCALIGDDALSIYPGSFLSDSMPMKFGQMRGPAF